MKVSVSASRNGLKPESKGGEGRKEAYRDVVSRPGVFGGRGTSFPSRPLRCCPWDESNGARKPRRGSERQRRGQPSCVDMHDRGRPTVLMSTHRGNRPPDVWSGGFRRETLERGVTREFGVGRRRSSRLLEQGGRRLTFGGTPPP